MSALLKFLGIGGASRGPLDPWWYSGVTRKTVSGESVDESVAMTYSAVWAATRLLSATGACLPLNLMQGDRRSKRVAVGHRVHNLIHKTPNGEMGSMMWRSTKAKQQINSGNAFSEIERDQLGRPVALWPIHHSRCKPCRADDELARQLGVAKRSLVWEVRVSDLSPSLEPDYIPDNDMLHIPSMISDNGIIGKGVIEHARESIGFGIATEKQGAAYMKNSARPLVVVRGGKFKTPEDREFYRQSWMEMHGGAENNAKPAMLPEDAEIDKLSFSPEDSQFLETREHNVEEIARWYGVPPHMIQDLRRATFTNIEHQGIEFVVYSMIPWLKIWEEQIERKLLTQKERETHFVKHNVEGLLRGDSKSRSEFYKSMFEIGAFSVNDILQLEDMNAIGSDGDKRFVPMNFTTLDKAGTEREKPKEQLDAMEVLRDELLAAIETSEVPDPVDLSPHRAAAEAVLVETVERMLAKEQAAAKSAACASKNNPGKRFLSWLDEFYGDRVARVSQAIEASLAAVIIFDGRRDAESLAKEVAERLIEESREMLLDMAGDAQPETLPEVVSNGVQNWQERAVEVKQWLHG